MRIILIIFSLVLIHLSAGAQEEYPRENPNEYDPLKMKLVLGTGAVVYTGTLIGLSQIWYADQNATDFHWFNDNEGWMQIDKFGHMYTAYMFGKAGYRSMMWAGAKRKTAIWLGGSYGFIFLTSVEILDGHYKEWGASATDMLANAMGAGLLIGQELGFRHQPVTMKFSYNPSPLAELRPEMLGENHIERVVKDYNGQTYWFSVNYRSVFRNQTIIPKWFNVAGGYGAYGMLGGNENPEWLPQVERYRRYFFSLDIDWDRIKTKSKFMKSVYFFLNLVKLPFPTIEFNSKGEVIFHPIYF